MRMIDAETAQKIADNELSAEDAGKVQYILSHTPTIDKPKGKWVDYIDNDEIWGETIYPQCNRCGFVEFIKTSFCPHCGIEMENGVKYEID